jgi:hypothetical protein
MEETPPEREFKTLMDVLRFLQGEGFSIEKTKLYQDQKSGLIRYKKGQPITETEVLAYVARVELEKTDGGSPITAARQLEKDNAAKRALALELMAQKREMVALQLARERKKLVDRSEVDQMLVGLLQVLDTSAKQLMDRLMPDIARMVGGDGAKANLGRDLLRQEWDAMMHRLSRTEAFELKYADEEKEFLEEG